MPAFSFPSLKGISLVCPPTAGTSGASLGSRLEVSLSMDTCMCTRTRTAISMATSDVRKRPPRGSCLHEDQARLLGSCQATAAAPPRAFLVRASQGSPPHICLLASLLNHSCPLHVTPEEVEINSQTEQDPESDLGVNSDFTT